MNPDPGIVSDPIAALRRAVQDAAEQLLRGESDAERAERLTARTAQLARTVESSSNAPAEIGIRHALSFNVNTGSDEPGYYGWPIESIHGIARVGKVTPVPSAPRSYRGVVNWRGQVLSALD